jgi:hypothetical protein
MQVKTSFVQLSVSESSFLRLSTISYHFHIYVTLTLTLRQSDFTSADINREGGGSTNRVALGAYVGGAYQDDSGEGWKWKWIGGLWVVHTRRLR